MACDVCDVTQDDNHLDRYLEFYRKLEVIKRMEIYILEDRHVEYDVIRHLSLLLLVDILCFYHQKNEKHAFFTENWFDNLLLMRVKFPRKTSHS